MDLKKLSSLQHAQTQSQSSSQQQQQQHIIINEQIPNRSSSNRLELIPPVTTHRQDTEELNKNIGSDYQDIQIRTLTKWINVQLNQVNQHIYSIDKDLKDGKKLLLLLSVVTNNTCLKPEKGNMRIHQLSNVAQALKFLQDQWGADSLPAIASEAIVNGDVKSTLAISFFIMLKYQIHPILLNNKLPPPIPLPTSTNNKSMMAEAKLALLYWVQSQLNDYISNQIISTIQDFSRSWRSGLAFCLLIHKHDSDLIPSLFTQHISHVTEKETWNTLLSLAFEIGFKHMNVPKYLEPADLLDVDYPHEPSVMMYVSELYKVMSLVITINQEDLLKRREEKRLYDIQLLVQVKNYQHMTPPTHDYDDVDDEVEDSSPSTPQPELLFNNNQQEIGNLYQHLDNLSLLLASSTTNQDIDQQLKDNQKSRLLLDNANQIISKLNSSLQEKQLLSNRYNQLKSEWEIKSKKLQVIQHDSNYINLNDPTMNLLYQIQSIHPLDDSSSNLVEEFQLLLSKLPENSSLVQTAYQLFKRGITFAQITSAIQDELEAIQQLMSNSGVNKSAVTDDLIQSLQQRIHVVNATIQGVRDEYHHDILKYDTGNDYFDRFINRVDDIEDRYEIVRDWVDQVRVWFVEAERIRTWIDKHIEIIEERNDSDTFNPVSRDITIADTMVIHLHEEHERLKQEIDHFDSDDMNRLRAHVKMLTHTATTEDQQHKELTPADTSTIEITLTTLTMLNQLTQLLNKRSHLIQLLLLRVKWEDLFGNAVQWIAQTDGELDMFLRGKARWSEKDESNYTLEEDDDGDQGIEGVIKTLVSLERKIADFDHSDYSNVLDAYQEMETVKNESLPDYLEMRQLGFEKAFEDLMKRSGFSRKVVEQLLSMINTVDKFKELRDVGERLRHHLLNNAEGHKIAHDDDVYAEQVQVFKEDSARLITNASSCIPYPDVPKMSTAIGANDAHDNQITNENIRSTISNYSMSLALIADGLDQLLMSRYQLLSLQQRANKAYDALARTKSWMEERIKLLGKSRFDLMLYTSQKQSPSNSATTTAVAMVTATASNDESAIIIKSNSSNTTHASTCIADDETLTRLEKERDSIALRLYQMENDDLAKLFETVRILEYDVDASNAVSIDRDHLVNGVESLEKTQQQLKDLLAQRGLQLDALKKRIDWETQWSKCNSHLHTIARKLCDFNVKKARYDPAKENVDKPSYTNDHENMQSLQFIQDRVAELGDRHLNSLMTFYQEMMESYDCLDSASLPEFLSTKQSDLKSEYEDLKHLSTYTLDLIAQRATITEFLLRAQDAHHEGEKIKDVVSKRTRRIMVKEEEDPTLDARVVAFKQEVKSIWQECGKNLPYPIYNGQWLRSSSHHHGSADNTAAGQYRSQVRAQIKALLDKKMEELAALEKSIDQLLEVYRDADRMKALVTQYEQEACQLGQWIDEQIETLKRQHLDVSAESFLARGMNVSDLKKARLDLFLKVDSFEGNKVKTLHDQIARLVQDSVEKKKNQSVDVSSAARHLGEVMDHLSQLKRGLSDQAVTLEAAAMRAKWESDLQLGITRLEEMNEQLRQFTTKKNQWISQDDLSEHHVQTLQQDFSRLISQKNKFEKSVLPGIQLSYDAFVEYFPKLARPMATPDHLEARMESLGRTATRFQENVAARSKELELIKQRIRWEDTVKQALVYLSEKEILIETFIEEKARWNSTAVDSNATSEHGDEDEVKLRTEWSNMHSNIKSYEQDVIVPLQKRFDHLVNENTNHYNNTSVSLLPNAFMKKMQDVQSAQDRASYYLNFSNDVVSQRCLVSAFILRTAQLEQSAELIREEFIATKANAQIVGLLENHYERLAKFKTGVDDVRRHLATSIPYPVRTCLENLSTQAKIKDETTNAVIHDTVEMRNTRLDELCSSLQQLLESKERVSRRRLSLHAYKKQAKVTDTWIDTRREILNRSPSFAQDIEKLKEAVSQADSVEQAMKAHESVFTTLNTTFDKCIAAFEDKSLDDEEMQDEDHEDLVEEFSDILEPTQKRISQAWHDLFAKVSEATKYRTALLVKNKIQSWLAAVDDLATRVQDESDDDQLLAWTDELDKLEHQEYQNLTVDVEAHKHVLGEEQLENIDSLFKSGLITIQVSRTKLSDLQNDLFLGQLISKYVNDISKLQYLIQTQIDHLIMTNEQYMLIDGESTPAARNTQYQNLVSEYKQVSDDIIDLKDLHDDVYAQYNAILATKKDYTDKTQENVSEKWNSLLSLESLVSGLISRSSKWVKYFNSLAVIRTDLEHVQSELSSVSVIAEEEKDAKFKQLDDKLCEIDVSLKGELSQMLDELVDDVINSKPFENQRAACLELKDKLKLDLHQHMTQREKSALIAFITAIIHRLCDQCDSQISLAYKHCGSFVFTEDKSVNATIDACSDTINSNNKVQTSIQNEVDALRLAQCNDLVTKIGCSEDQVDLLIAPLSLLLEKLEYATKSEKECLSLAKLLSTYMSSEMSIITTVDACISRLAADQDIDEEVVSDLEGQLESLDDNKKELYITGHNITHFEHKDMLQSETRIANTSLIIQKSKKELQVKYDTFIVMLQKSRLDIEKVKQRQLIISKLNDLIDYIADMTDRVNALQLSGKGVTTSSEERELEELRQDFYQTLTKKTKVSDALLANYEEAEGDEEIKDLRGRLFSGIAALNALISIKRKEASDEGDLSEFLGIMAEFDEQISILSCAIENASPHHSNIINNKFVKSDLQALLRSLIAAYKQHQHTVLGVLERARNESKKQFLGDNERVADGIRKATKKWTQVQAAAAARERELQTCIGNLDHEFFTKLAMAKTKSKSSSSSAGPALSSQTPSVKRHSAVPAAASPASTRFVGTVSSFPRRSVDETNKRSSKTPVSASSSASRISRASYVPDPRNALDIELGRIVNAHPYRINVNIVPDQVGKYWFGDENPRLVYCRILTSQLVMVRVGGGWVELSKFLREHGLAEGVYSRPTSSHDTMPSNNQHENTPFQESYLQTLRSLSPSGRVTIRGGGNSSSLASTRSSSKSSGSRSRSPLPGFVDGDKFISLDEAGNHLVVKMKKAENDVKMPIIKKKH